MADRQNRFAKIDDVHWLELNFLAAVSPENLHADGERSGEGAMALFTSIRADYNARLRELAA